MRHGGGFSLLEMAVVLVILGLVLGGLLGPLSASVEQKALADTDASLALAREALLGFAMVNGRLPCPDADTDDDGDEDCPAAGEGELPWRTLGLTRAMARDAWGNALRYRPDAAFTAIGIADPPATVDGLRVSDADGIPLTASNPSAPVAVVLARGKDGVGNGDNGVNDMNFTVAAYCSAGCAMYFDDRLIVLARNVLIARLAAAGRWP